MANLQEIIPAIFTGPNGERLTPEQIAQRQQVAQSLLGRATDTRPDGGGWASVLNKALMGGMAGYDMRQADDAISTNAEASQQSIASMLGSLGLGGGNAYPSAVAAGQSPTSAAATGTPVSIPAAPEIRQGLIDRGFAPHLADAAILNFQDESGLNPGINEQNPTVPGSRGGYGLYQLTGPRRVAYEQFAAQRGVSPSDVNAQLDFFANELGGSEKAAGQKFFAAPDTATAAQVLVNDFLRPAQEHRQSRSAKYGRVATTPQEAIAQVAPQVSPDMASFDNRWDAGAVPVPSEAVVSPQVEQTMPEMANAVMPQTAQQPTGPSESLLAQNDMMLGGALSPSGSSPVAQALSGSFPAAPSAQGHQSQGRINPAIVAALSNPYASQQERQIAGMLLGQQMEQAQAQQDFQQKMAIQAAAPVKGVEINGRLVNPMTGEQIADFSDPNKGLLNAGNGAIYNPNTGEWIQAPQGAQQTFRQATPEEANKYGAPSGQFGPDGRFYPINPPSGMTLETTPEGGVRLVQGSGVQNRPLTEGQSKDTVYATRAEGSLPILDKFGSSLASPIERAKEYDPTGLARSTQSPEFQQARQAGDEFLQAILRKDTGAAITTDEMNSYGRTYLPMPGDGEQVLAQKAISRTRALEAMKAGMPPQAILQQEEALKKSSNKGSIKPVSEMSNEELEAIINGN